MNIFFCKTILILSIIFFSFIFFSQTYKQNYLPQKSTYKEESQKWDIKKGIFYFHPNFTNQQLEAHVEYQILILEQLHFLHFKSDTTLILDSIKLNNKRVSLLSTPLPTEYKLAIPNVKKNKRIKVQFFYHGKPRQAILPPWQAGLTWGGVDSLQRHWLTTTCQDVGSFIWFPSKAYLGDKIDSTEISIKVPKGMIGVSNGKLIDTSSTLDETIFTWQTSYPIVPYNISMNIGYYKHFSDTILFKKKTLNLDFYFLDYDIEKAKKKLLPEVKRTLTAFQNKLTPYPFPKDHYKLVQVNYLGMEHQSAIAYGNQFLQGYKGRDISKTNIGLRKDFIVVHETGHEWFGNAVTMKNYQDMWLHEAFTSYSESIFLEYFYGLEDAKKYTIGKRHRIKNDKPIYPSEIDSTASSDMYFKGENIILSFRNLINNDKLFFKYLKTFLLRFQYQSIDTKMFLQWTDSFFKKDYSSYFLQYLNHAYLPILCYKITQENSSSLAFHYYWKNTDKNFTLPIKLLYSINHKIQDTILINPKVKSKKIILPKDAKNFVINPKNDFLIQVQKLHDTF